MIAQIRRILKRPKVKILAKFFLFFFLLFILFLNYKYLIKIVSYFNYRVLSVKIVLKPHIPSFLLEFQNVEKNQTKEIRGYLFIPKIQIKAPIIFPVNNTNTSPLYLKKYLDKGVLFYPGSVLPGQSGQTVILGHSAPANWPKINYDTVFSNLNNLAEGDEARLGFNNDIFVYKVVKKVFLKPGDEIPDLPLTNDENVLILISCWPPGKNYKRIAVAAVLKF
ncbi:hypothetical protein COT20_02950 [bacterium (Candidatus Gribaldobacteria) CG08_land_8_20_14_0_20_39_15]|uniref:Sortase n=1 Tax=bacterium (Candidatus Gribaldobacteria) CG08_land_8_20_14_0_20_39_15 TaxID=2014273 RepID=A0A2M6XTS1_9BACT|nr:MAG: hypothetical protein COT20_02950 [bacterium (Candidatus Gribaldobacteria) CG08_land_8_20_14_0_20_39_15]